MRHRRRNKFRFSTSTKNMFSKGVTNPTGTADSMDLVVGTAPQAERTLNTQVPAGAHVFSMDIYVNAIVPSGGERTLFLYTVQYTRSGQSVETAIEFASLGLSNQRNQVLVSEMAQCGTEDAGPIRRKFHFKVPKIIQRVREGDKITLVWKSNGATVEVDMGVRYKYYQ